MSQQEKIFINGLIAKKPHEKAPDFIKANLAINLQEFFDFAKHHTKKGWINMQVKESKDGKWYVELDTYETPADKKFEQTKKYIENVVLGNTPQVETSEGGE